MNVSEYRTASKKQGNIHSRQTTRLHLEYVMAITAFYS